MSNNNSDLTFGRRALQTETADQLLALERQEGRDARFKEIDTIIGSYLYKSLRGERVAALTRDSVDNSHVGLLDLTADQCAFLDEAYALERQRERGALFHPAKASLKVGLASLPHFFDEYGRFGYGMASEERNQVELNEVDALLFWALLEVLFETLYLPITIRSQLVGKKSREEQQALWAEVDAFYAAMGWCVEEALAVMRYGGGWHKLQIGEQWEAKKRLIASLSSQVQPNLGSLVRAHQLRALLAAYYKKAKSGQAIRRQVLTKALERLLAGWFGGDWLALLDYLGESPHASEQILTALPETRLFVRGANRVVEVAVKAGLPTEEVQKMVAAFWQQSDGASPIEERVTVLRRYWQNFDVIHNQQQPGMTPLWGLVEEARHFRLYNNMGFTPYTPGLYRNLLPADLLKDVERLWGTTMLPQWPEGMVTEVFPHTAMADALGPALTFWHSAALTAWFICEGPMSRTDMAGLAHYHRRPLDYLEKAGTPIDIILFDELIEGERVLGPEQTVERDVTIQETSSGITKRSFVYTRRDGFERLRDIISRYRQIWMQQYFEKYLRFKWESELREAATQHALQLGSKGKPPTIKQFSKYAAAPTNHWFGGDISKFYAAIGEKAPCQPRYQRLMPADTVGFVQKVAQLLEGTLPRPNDVAQDAVWYLQLQEAIGTSPKITQFGRSRLEWPAQQANLTPDQLWALFVQAISTAMV